jgi:hypothetical protein
MRNRGLGAIVVFLAGCATGGVASRLIPPASAQQQTAVNAGQFAAPVFAYWDHLCFEAGNSYEDVTAMAREAGVKGWELVGTLSYPSAGLCFKRPLPPK